MTQADLIKYEAQMQMCKNLNITPYELFAYSIALEAKIVAQELNDEDPSSNFTQLATLELMCKGELDDPRDLIIDLYSTAIEFAKLMDPIVVVSTTPGESK
jgi:hypothetical protein